MGISRRSPLTWGRSGERPTHRGTLDKALPSADNAPGLVRPISSTLSRCQGRRTMNAAAEPKASLAFSTMLVVMALMAFGIVMVASASVSLDRPLFSTPLLATPWARQAVFAACGLLLMLAVRYVMKYVLPSPKARLQLTLAVFVLTMLGLIAALIPGLAESHRGSNRWLRFHVGGLELGVQPSEFAKLAMVALLAAVLAPSGNARVPKRRRWHSPFVMPHLPFSVHSSRTRFYLSAAALGVGVLLVGKEDFGTAVLLSLVGVAMLIVAGCPMRHLSLMGAAGSCALATLLYAAPYRLARLETFLNLNADPQGAGYQPLQSLVTIASGGWTGLGLGAGVQKYGYLPESHSDFIFAIICEETGVLGATLVILLFAALVYLGLRTMLVARSQYERLLAFGLATTIGLQAAMNVAVVLVVAPTTGISLPYVSAGGSGLMTFSILAGVLAAIADRGAVESDLLTPDSPASPWVNVPASGVLHRAEPSYCRDSVRQKRGDVPAFTLGWRR